MASQDGRKGHKDLQDLRSLPRSPALSFLQKQAQPKTPRPPADKANPVNYPKISAFFKGQIFSWIGQYLANRFGPRHEFTTYVGAGSDNGIYKLEANEPEIRIALAADWGTGTDEAARVAQHIVEFDPHYSIHLGDVYFVGDLPEVNENFLGIANPANDYAPVQWPMGNQGSFALNGNHEMYARGIAYFDNMLPALGIKKNDTAQGQRASYFCLENDHWRFIAVDTGYNSVGWPLLEEIFPPDCALKPELLEWLRTVVQPRADDPRGIVVLSHHQYFSAFDASYPKPARQMAEFFPRPVLWFWGHEHRMTIYKQCQMDGGVTAFGRCIGNGGMPVDLPPATPTHSEYPVEFVDSRVYEGDENLKIGFNGFTRLTVRGPRLRAEYVDLNNNVTFSEDWLVDGGTLTRTAHNP